jgi:hypothetical protein
MDDGVPTSLVDLSGWMINLKEYNSAPSIFESDRPCHGLFDVVALAIREGYDEIRFFRC